MPAPRRRGTRRCELGLDRQRPTPRAAEAVKGADLVILCAPVGAYGAIAAEIGPHLEARRDPDRRRLGQGRGRPRLSARTCPRACISSPAIRSPAPSIPGPKSGFAELFDGRWCILTPLPGADPAAVEQAARRSGTALGSKVEIMDAEHHDMVLAITSHVPHLIAYNIVNTAAHLERVTDSEVIKFSAGGFRDFTRIAASDPTMWRDVFLNNKEAVLEMLGRFTEDLTALQRAIRYGDGDTLFKLFTDARADPPRHHPGRPGHRRAGLRPDAPRTTERKLKGEPPACSDLWIFGYGSLMWRPGFAFAEAARARAGRLSPLLSASTRPIIAAAVSGPAWCSGSIAAACATASPIASRREHARATRRYLRVREQVNGVYREALVPVTIEEGKRREVLAQAYIVERAHPSYTGPLTLRQQARIIRGAKGLSGANLDYLINTLAHLDELDINEPELRRILTLIGPHFARGNHAGQVSPRAAALLKSCRQRPCIAARSRPGERRRFIHRRQLAVWHAG